MARAATHLFARKNLYREHAEGEKDRCDAAIHHSEKKNPCRDKGKDSEKATVQRYTISGREPCIASIERGRSTDAVQRYPIFDRKTCIANMNNGRRPCTVQRHTFSQEKTCIASTEREKKADVMQRHTISREKTCVASTEREKKTNRSHTTLHNTIRSSYKTTTHHITTISKPDNPTNRQTPYHTSNTIHYSTIQQKAPPPKPEEELY